MTIAVLLELGHSDGNLFDVLEDTAMADLSLQRPFEAFGNAIGLRLGGECETSET